MPDCVVEYLGTFGNISTVLELGLEELKLFPNPVENFLFIENLISPIGIEIFNVQGDLALKATTYPGKAIDVSSLSTGLHYLVSNVHSSVSFFKK
jgi:hypothetical protein